MSNRQKTLIAILKRDGPEGAVCLGSSWQCACLRPFSLFNLIAAAFRQCFYRQRLPAAEEPPAPLSVAVRISTMQYKQLVAAAPVSLDWLVHDDTPHSMSAALVVPAAGEELDV
jgi:hypothetical protein